MSTLDFGTWSMEPWLEVFRPSLSAAMLDDVLTIASRPDQDRWMRVLDRDSLFVRVRADNTVEDVPAEHAVALGEEVESIAVGDGKLFALTNRGALVQVGHTGTLVTVLATAAVLLASINVFGGFAVTRRMLAMFTRG